MKLECANCGSLDMDHGDTWHGMPVCYECNQRGFHLANEQRDRALRAEAALAQAVRERDEEESRFQSGRALIRHQENTIRSLAGQVASLQPGAKDCALRVRAERAEKALKRAREERDEARAQAVWSIHVNAPIGWVACAPGGGGEGLRLVDGAWVEQTMCISEGTRFSTEAEALAAGRAVPWWEVKA